jgi:hypothetical protein
MTATARQALRVLLLEDSPSDAELVVLQLQRAGFEPMWQRVETKGAFLAALDPALDVILADFNLPSFNALHALELVRERRLDVPLIVVSGSIGEDVAVNALQEGAADYLLKDRLTRLGQAIQRARDERRLHQAKREAEETLRQTVERTTFALEAAHIGIWEADLATGAVRWSDILEAMHGLPADGFGGTFEAFLDAIVPEDRQTAADEIAQATAARIESNVLYRTRWPDGSLHWIQGIGRTFFDDSGTPVRAAGIGIDVTERRQLEDQYRQSQKIEAIGQLAGGVAHDFNNLLTAILGYCELLIESVGPASQHRAHLDEIRRAADSAASLTRQLLAFGRRQILEPRVLDLHHAVCQMEPMLRRLIGEDIAVVVHKAGEVGRIRADVGQIEQVILNLAINARDAMLQGGTLRIDVADVDLDESYARRHAGSVAGPYVMLAVSDTGTGMDAATQTRVFEPFFTTKAKGRGTGLGLSTVHGIVQQSGGTIWVYSEPGRGSTFKVYLPRVDAPVEKTARGGEPTSLTGSETILVLEDETGVRDLVRRVLERYGYRVLVAETPHEALAVAEEQQGQIQLLISDVVLPEMTGPAVAERIVAAQPQIRVLYMSGYTDSDIVHRGVLDEGTPFLQKPFVPEALARKVREVLQASRM